MHWRAGCGAPNNSTTQKPQKPQKPQNAQKPQKTRTRCRTRRPPFARDTSY